jgi:predicted  nucleic acid-binding Zn-ribbon protein
MSREISHTEETAEQTTLRLEETKDRISRIESDVAGLRAAMTNSSAKIEEVQRDVASQKAQPFDCWSKVKQNVTNPE